MSSHLRQLTMYIMPKTFILTVTDNVICADLDQVQSISCNITIFFFLCLGNDMFRDCYISWVNKVYSKYSVVHFVV